MDQGRVFPKKYKTRHAYGKRKRKPATAKKMPRVSVDSSSEVAQVGTTTTTLPSDVPCERPAGSSEIYDPGPSTSYADSAQLRQGRTLDFASKAGSAAALISHRRKSPPSSSGSYRSRECSRERSLSAGRAGTPLSGAPWSSGVPSPSSEISGASFFDASTDASVSAFVHPPPTIQQRLETTYVSAEAAQAQASAVRESLGAMSATERKFMLTGQESETSTSSDDGFIVIQISALNSLIGQTLCPSCHQPTLNVDCGTRMGLAVKMVLTCTSCGVRDSVWTSGRKEGAKTFEVNLRSMQAIKSIGKGQTALNDFWATMNVSHRGLHHKTYQEHLKKTFSPAAASAAQNIFADAVSAVKEVYQEMEVTFSKNITVVYDGTWLTRGHSSHIGVGCVIEFYTGLVLDCTVLSNFCLGCNLGPKETEDSYQEWKKNHRCQKNTNVGAGRMEVEAALELFRRSLSKNDLRYTTIVCDGDCRTYLTLCEDKTYGFMRLTKEDCVNHVQKRMGTNLRNILTKSRKGEFLGGRGGLTQDLIKKLTNFYGLALRKNTEVDDMQRAVMATYYHVTSTDAEPHHELCPPGPLSWCKHRSAEAEGKPQPPHKYKLSRRVAEALLPVYQRLSDPQLLERCKGNKTQNAAESLHSVIWSVLSKDEHASLFAVETAVHEAVARYNSGNRRAYVEFCASLGIQPAAHALRRASEKDLRRSRKAAHAHQIKGQRTKKATAPKDTKDYASGAF